MKGKEKKEPQIVVKPIGKYGGLDTIHLSLIALVVILIALLAVISYSKPQVIPNSNATSTTTISNYSNATVAKPVHTSAEVANITESILASYNYIGINSSLSVYLPYFSEVNNMSIAYMPSTKEWNIIVPIRNPLTGKLFDAEFQLYDSNLTLANSYIQMVMPSKILGDKVVYPGVISMSGKFACGASNTVQVFWFIDPYAPGSVLSLENLSSLQNSFGSNVNATVKILYGAYSQIIGSKYGATNAQALGKYIFCASQQQNFSKFVTSLNAIYSNNYMSMQTLQAIARYSSLNMSSMSSCIANSTTIINRQALLAEYYNITETPEVIVDCRYLALPQTAGNAVCYSNSAVCKG
ncbi:MAG: hypothetical protein ACP5RF_03705 [Candidatus Micrarchaeia archaeon]